MLLLSLDTHFPEAGKSLLSNNILGNAAWCVCAPDNILHWCTWICNNADKVCRSGKHMCETTAVVESRRIRGGDQSHDMAHCQKSHLGDHQVSREYAWQAACRSSGIRHNTHVNALIVDGLFHSSVPLEAAPRVMQQLVFKHPFDHVTLTPRQLSAGKYYILLMLLSTRRRSASCCLHGADLDCSGLGAVSDD